MCDLLNTILFATDYSDEELTSSDDEGEGGTLHRRHRRGLPHGHHDRHPTRSDSDFTDNFQPPLPPTTLLDNDNTSPFVHAMSLLQHHNGTATTTITPSHASDIYIPPSSSSLSSTSMSSSSSSTMTQPTTAPWNKHGDTLQDRYQSQLQQIM
jgi:hypothetical protein